MLYFKDAAKILTMAGPVIEGGSLAVDDQGKISAIGKDLPVPRGARVIDAAGKILMPGLIDAHTHIGICEEIYPEGDDINEISDPVTPQLRAIDAVNMEDLALQDAVAGGITTVMTGPGSANVVCGQSLVMKTTARTVDEAILKNPSGMKVAFGENPKRVYGERKKKPVTRMATAATLREALVEAQNYGRARAEAERHPEQKWERNLKWEALLPVTRGELPLFIHSHRADDIMTALRIVDEFGLKCSLHHATEGHKIPDELARRGIPAVVGPMITNRAKVELKDRTLATAGVLARAGVTVAIMTDHPVVPIQYLAFSASLAVRGGLDIETALKAITINAARILGVADRVGSLEAGKDADLILLDGELFNWRTNIMMTVINGKIVHNADRSGLVG